MKGGRGWSASPCPWQVFSGTYVSRSLSSQSPDIIDASAQATPFFILTPVTFLLLLETPGTSGLWHVGGDAGCQKAAQSTVEISLFPVISGERKKKYSLL